MSRRKSSETPGVPAGSYRKPRPDMYTVLLVIALVAILTGIVFLCLEMNAYEWTYQGGPMVMSGEQPAVISCQFSVDSYQLSV